jgi:hypothetical protein
MDGAFLLMGVLLSLNWLPAATLAKPIAASSVHACR